MAPDVGPLALSGIDRPQDMACQGPMISSLHSSLGLRVEGLGSRFGLLR